MPAGKQFHVFATHKKERKQTEHLVVHMKDMLEHKGVSVFFDCDDLAQITQDELNSSIKASCVLVVFLDDLTFNSKWVSSF